MLDEPLSAVDAVRKTSLEQTIRATLKAAGASALWITHDLDEALLVSDRLLVVGGRPLTILHDEGLERRPDDIQGMIGSSAFQMHRIELHRRVAELWPADRL
jgi:ABC-type nitrate/sulfonate/bicarbonate transport system ATPase subunit